MMCEFKTSSNPIALNQCLIVYVFLEHTSLYHFDLTNVISLFT